MQSVEWRRGFPQRTGFYLVKLADGERQWTKYTVPGDGGDDTWGDPHRGGWTCLTGSHTRVVAWCEVPDYEPPSTIGGLFREYGKS
jgi:hypothetical protein